MKNKTERYIRFIGAFMLMGLFFMLVGCTEKDPVLQIQRGSVAGMVLDENKKGVAGVKITSNRSLYTAETDSMGRYMFTSLDTGHHVLSAERDGYYLGSKTIELAYGQTLEGIDIVVEGMEKMINTSVAVRERNQVILDVYCHEPMSVSVSYRENATLPINTAPTEMDKQHRIALTNLFPGSEYRYTVTGTTADGRQFSSGESTFKTVYIYDIDGAPSSPENLVISQSTEGPVLGWEYKGADPIQGFRIYRGENGGKQVLIRDEKDVLSSQTKLTDDSVFGGRYYTYSVYAVDFEGNLSEIPASKSFIPNGRMTENIVWKKEWSPINIEGDFTIPERYTLTIEPGTSIRFKSGDNSGNSFNADICEFVVEGTLIACGTSDEPIMFLSQASVPGKGDWDGIRFTATDAQEKSCIDNVIVSGADSGLEIYGNNIEISNFTARYCNTGLNIITASGSVYNGLGFEDCNAGLKADSTTNCVFCGVTANNCGTGVVFNNNTLLNFNNFDLRNNVNSGIQVIDKNMTVIRNGVIHSVSKGMSIAGEGCDAQFVTIDAVNGIVIEGAVEVVVQNNIIVNQIAFESGTGIEDMTGNGRAFPFNNIYGFAMATANCTQFGTSILNTAPGFMGNTASGFDYHLSESSPLLTESSTNGQLGAYGN